VSKESVLRWLERAGLSLAFGATLVATRLFVLESGFYDMPHAHHNMGSDWALDFVFFATCCFALLVAYGILNKKRRTDAPLHEMISVSFLGLGGLLGTMGAVFDGWRNGIELFVGLGCASAVLAVCFVGAAYGIVYFGKKLDSVIRRPDAR